MARTLTPATFVALTTALGAACAPVAPRPASRALAVWEAHRAAPGPGPAQEAPRTLALGLEEAARLAVRSSGEAAVLRAQARARRARGEAAAVLPNPELRVTNVRVDQLADGTPTFDAALRVRFEPPGTLAAARNAERLEGDALDADADAVALERAGEVRQLYAEAALLTEAVRLADREVGLYEALAAQLESAVARGRALRTDAASAALDRADALAARQELALKQAEALGELRVLLGLPPATELVLDASDVLTPTIPALARQGDEAVARAALTTRPELAAAAARVARGRALVDGARWLAWPRLGFAQVGWEHTADRDPWALAVGVGVDLPIFDAGGAQTAEARAQLEAWEAEEEALAVQIGAEAVAAARRVRDAEARLAAFSPAHLEIYEQAIEAYRAAEAVGAEAPDRRTRAERQLVRAERARIEALLALHEALAAFHAAVGLDVGGR